MSKEVIRPFIKVTNKKHPHYGEDAMILEKDVQLSLSFLGKMDKAINVDGREFFIKREDYKIIG